MVIELKIREGNKQVYAILSKVAMLDDITTAEEEALRKLEEDYKTTLAEFNGVLVTINSLENAPRELIRNKLGHYMDGKGFKGMF